jgi:hypothetical protein
MLRKLLIVATSTPQPGFSGPRCRDTDRQVLGAVDRPRRCRLGILSPACRASSWYPSAILSMRAFTTGSFIASAAVRISSARFRQCSGLCKRYRVVIAATS